MNNVWLQARTKRHGLCSCFGLGDGCLLARFEAAHRMRHASASWGARSVCLRATKGCGHGFGTGAAIGSAWDSCVVCDAATQSWVVGIALTASGLRGPIPALQT